MKKRARKKIHKFHLMDIVCDVSISLCWRKQLYQSQTGDKLIIDNSINLYKEKQKNLKYYVSVVPYAETKGCDDWLNDQIYFKFESVEFPNVMSFSANNRNVI